jgi:hypothetical protein
MKGLIFRILVLVALVAPGTMQAQFGYMTNTDGVNTITITNYTGSGGTVNIPTRIGRLLVTRIGDEGLMYCSATNITVPGHVISIGNGAFMLCDQMTSITISNGVGSVGDYAFQACNDLISVAFPASVTNLGVGLFGACDSLITITVDPENAFYSSVNGVLFNKNQTTLMQFPLAVGGSYAIPGSVTNIQSQAFLQCLNLTNVTIPGSVISIGDYAFQTCQGLTSMTIPGSVTNIGVWGFTYCTSLTSVYFMVPVLC